MVRRKKALVLNGYAEHQSPQAPLTQPVEYQSL